MELAPVVVFCYNRLESLKNTIDALRENFYSVQTDLYIYSDAPKSSKDVENVEAVRKYIHSITGFKSITIKEASLNKGLALSIITGVSEIITLEGKVIVLEDDLISSNNFLAFMNESLNYYESYDNVFSISGYTSPIKCKTEFDVYFTKRSSSWGWATWKDKWQQVDWNVSDYKHFVNDKKAKRLFNQMGSDLSSMLDKQMNGHINSWAIRWCYSQFKLDKLTVFPSISKIKNIGFNSALATHTNDRFSRFNTNLDSSSKLSFAFMKNPEVDPSILKYFLKPYSLLSRAQYKIYNKTYSLYKRFF